MYINCAMLLVVICLGCTGCTTPPTTDSFGVDEPAFTDYDPLEIDTDESLESFDPLGGDIPWSPFSFGFHNFFGPFFLNDFPPY